MIHDMSKHITKVSAKPTMRTEFVHYAQIQFSRSILYKLKVIHTYDICGIVIRSANKKQYSAFAEKLIVKSLGFSVKTHMHIL